MLSWCHCSCSCSTAIIVVSHLSSRTQKPFLFTMSLTRAIHMAAQTLKPSDTRITVAATFAERSNARIHTHTPTKKNNNKKQPESRDILSSSSLVSIPCIQPPTLVSVAATEKIACCERRPWRKQCNGTSSMAVWQAFTGVVWVSTVLHFHKSLAFVWHETDEIFDDILNEGWVESWLEMHTMVLIRHLSCAKGS